MIERPNNAIVKDGKQKIASENGLELVMYVFVYGCFAAIKWESLRLFLFEGELKCDVLLLSCVRSLLSVNAQYLLSNFNWIYIVMLITFIGILLLVFFMYVWINVLGRTGNLLNWIQLPVMFKNRINKANLEN